MTKILTMCENCQTVWYWEEEEKTFYLYGYRRGGQIERTDELNRCSEEPITETRKEFWCGCCDRFIGEYEVDRGLMVGDELDDDYHIPKGEKRTKKQIREEAKNREGGA